MRLPWCTTGAMDSVTQFVLGAAVSAEALGTRTAARKAVVWGGVIATLPDLDVLIDHGDAVRNMVEHRAQSHSLFWLTLLSPLLVARRGLGGGFSQREHGSDRDRGGQSARARAAARRSSRRRRTA